MSATVRVVGLKKLLPTRTSLAAGSGAVGDSAQEARATRSAQANASEGRRVGSRGHGRRGWRGGGWWGSRQQYAGRRGERHQVAKYRSITNQYRICISGIALGRFNY